MAPPQSVPNSTEALVYDIPVPELDVPESDVRSVSQSLLSLHLAGTPDQRLHYML